MPTMYETLRELPLFKGTTTDQISSFLEKTNVDFVRFNPGDIVMDEGQICSELKFIMSGEVRVFRTLSEGKAALASTQSYGAVFTPCFTFGLDTVSPVRVEALTTGSYMSIRKNQYFELLQTDSIYLLNYLNYLSYNVQRAQKAITELSCNNLINWLTTLKNGVLERRTVNAEIITTKADLADILSISLSEAESQLEAAASSGLISFSDDLIIKLI